MRRAISRVKLLPGARPLALALLLGALALLPACKRKPNSAVTPPAGGTTLTAAVSPPKVLPTYSFRDDDIKRSYPDVIAFVDEFLQTCLTGDYLAYRRLVSRHEKPESRERFAAIYQGLRSIVVESIEAVDSRALRRALGSRSSDTATSDGAKPTGLEAGEAASHLADVRGPVYLIISTVNFDPEKKVALRRSSGRKVGILAFEEDGAWRMAPAPAELQPHDSPRHAAEGDKSPSEPIPDYPWDKDGDG